MKLLNVKEVKDSYNRGNLIDFEFFWGGYLSNWFVSPFEIEGVRYFCVEQYMMAMKAKIFNDTVILQKIMQSTDQKEIKGLGRKVKNYDDKVWEKERVNVVFNGNYAKFTQNKKLKDYLLSTGNKVLVEASPFDTIWGIGIGEKDKGVSNPNHWYGTNLLGFTLMSVRERIRNEVI